ncbi:MAG TPA: AAA family ATPase, partial [Actinomycetes bacterium]|nr:AAA family ATPase [Actinomycetes bacterium]
MRLLERDAQLSELLAALVRARRGRGTTVLVAGEAGIGKTWLLQEFAARVAPAARVLLGTCEDLLTPRTLGPFRDMARDAGGALGKVGGDDRDAFIDALLEEMGFSQRPAVVIVEDAHWADEASLDIIRYLARRVERLPAMVVVSYRDEELTDEHLFRRLVGALAGPAVLRIELEGLSDAAVAQLAAAAGLDPGRVVATVGGNPFYLTEVLAAPGSAVPPSVRHAVLARFASLPPPCRSALERLAVVPAETETWLAAALLDDPAALEPAERRGMLVAAHGRIRFRHELARRVVELSLPPTRRAGHHRRVLRALEAAGAEPSRMVHHAVAAGDEAAVARHAAAAAGEAAKAEGHREAAAFAQLALERGGARFDRLTVARLHGQAAAALFALNRFGEAAGHADRAVAIWDQSGTTPLELGEALLISARMSTYVADPAAARAKALRALGILEPLGPSHALALCYSTLAAQHSLQAQFEAAEAWAGRALDLARRIGSMDVVAHALSYRGVARASQGDEAGFADMERAVETARQAGHGDYLAVAAHNRAILLIRSARPIEGERDLDVAERAAREHGFDAHLFLIEAARCQVLMLRGAWDEAERRLRGLLGTAHDPGSNLANSMAVLGRILARRGDPEARTLVDRAWA